MKKETQIFLTQNELADRWRCSEATIKNLRDRGVIPYFKPPKSSIVRFPIIQIKEFEKSHTVPPKEVIEEGKLSEKILKTPDISATEKEWRV